MSKNITIAIKNNTTIVQPIQLSVTPNEFSGINANTQYRWNITSQSLTNLSSVSITYTLNGVSTTATANITQQTVSGIIDALNSLNVGSFWSTTSGGNTYINTYNDFVTYSDLQINVNANIQLVATVIAFGSLSFIITQSAPNNIEWDWGDGTVQTFTVANPSPSHIYTVGGTYTISIIFSNPALLLSFIVGNLDQADVLTNDFTGLQTLRLENGSLTSFDASNLSNSSALTLLALDNNLMTSFNPSPLVSTLQTIFLQGNSLTSFTAAGIPIGVKTLLMHVNNLSTTIINAILIRLDASGQINGTVNVSGQTPAAPPSGAGITAKNNLIGNGWTVTTD